MGRQSWAGGIALQAANKFPTLPKALGKRIIKHNLQLELFTAYSLIAFPVKHNWFDKVADINLITESTIQLIAILDSYTNNIKKIYLPRPGCGNGKLRWKDVKRALKDIIDDRVIIVEKPL